MNLRRLHPASDAAALERHAYALFAQAAEETAQRSVRRTAQRNRLHAAALRPLRVAAQETGESAGTRVPFAYQLWLAHLLWLEEVAQTLACRPADLTAAELAGLLALARARARFLRNHPFCPRCDAANPRLPAVEGLSAGEGTARRCRVCSQEF